MRKSSFALRLWGLIWTALCGVALVGMGGCADAGITVTLTAWPAGASEVRVVPSLDGTAGGEITLTPDQTVFVVRVPQGRGHSLTLGAVAWDGGGCKVATGTAQTDLPGGLRPYGDIALGLDALAPALCPLTLRVTGAGSAQAAWTVAGVVKTLSCAADQTCTVELPRTTPNPLAVSITARESNRREFSAIGGGCVGLHDCTVRIARAQTVTVQMMPRQCSADGFCVMSPAPYAVHWNAIWGAAANDIWAVGTGPGAGAIGHFDGRAWTLVPTSGKLLALNAVWGSAANDVWAVGGAGEVQHYDGTSWARVNSGLTVNLWAVWGSSAQDVWVAGENGYIRRWTGSAFGTVSSSGAPMTGAYRAIWGSGPSDIWVVGDNATFWHYNGTSGAPVTTPYNNLPLWSIWGRSATDIWATAALTAAGNVLHWNGQSWQQVSAQGGAEPAYTVVWGLPSAGPWIGAVTGALVQNTRGSWTLAPSVSKEILRGIWGSSENDVWVVGDNGAMLHWDGVEWRSYSEGVSNAWTAMWGSGPDDVWVGGLKGTLAHWDGVKFVSSAALGGTSSDIAAMHGSASNTIYLVGTKGLIAYYGGQNWAQQVAPATTPVISGLESVWCNGVNDVWAGGTKGAMGVLARKTGATWTEQTMASPLADSSIGAIFGSSSTDVAISNRNGYVSTWGGTGLSTSVQIPVGAGQSINAIWVDSSGEGFAAGGSGGIWRRPTRSGAWSLIAPSGPTMGYSTLAGRSLTDVWVTDVSGNVLQWNGSGFAKRAVLGTWNGRAATVTGPGDVWVAGVSATGGTIFRYMP